MTKNKAKDSRVISSEDLLRNYPYESTYNPYLTKIEKCRELVNKMRDATRCEKIVGIQENKEVLTLMLQVIEQISNKLISLDNERSHLRTE